MKELPRRSMGQRAMWTSLEESGERAAHLQTPLPHTVPPVTWLRAPAQARASMQAEMELKKEEAARQRQRIQELEEMQQRLEEALHLEVKARRDEEAVRLAQTR